MAALASALFCFPETALELGGRHGGAVKFGGDGLDGVVGGYVWARVRVGCPVAGADFVELGFGFFEGFEVAGDEGI